jgi:hypothetical protein
LFNSKRRKEFDASLPEVVRFKLFLDEAEPVCPAKPLPVGEKTVCEACEWLLADVDAGTVLLDDVEESNVAVFCDDEAP